jgi:hypothetical protein
VEPIESGKVGRVAVGGVVQLKAADLGKASGAHVLWKDSTWALVRIQSGVVRGTFTAPWAKDATTTVTDAITTSATYTGVKNYLNSIGGTGERSCLIAYVGNEWVLVAVAPQGVVRGTFTAPWDKGSTKTVADAVTSGTTYADVKNYFANVAGTGTKACAIAYVGTEWILIAAECS